MNYSNIDDLFLDYKQKGLLDESSQEDPFDKILNDYKKIPIAGPQAEIDIPSKQLPIDDIFSEYKLSGETEDSGFAGGFQDTSSLESYKPEDDPDFWDKSVNAFGQIVDAYNLSQESTDLDIEASWLGLDPTIENEDFICGIEDKIEKVAKTFSLKNTKQHENLIEGLKKTCRKYAKEKTGKKPITNINVIRI